MRNNNERSRRSRSGSERSVRNNVTASDNGAFMRLLVESGFGLALGSAVHEGNGELLVVESKNSFRNAGKHEATAEDNTSGVGGTGRVDINALPGAKTKMPTTVHIRFKPAQSVVTTPRFNPKIRPRLLPKNQQDVFDTLAEHRDFLMERYTEAIDRVREQRQEKIDDRLEKNAELRQRQKEASESWKSLQDPASFGLRNNDPDNDDEEDEEA